MSRLLSDQELENHRRWIGNDKLDAWRIEELLDHIDAITEALRAGAFMLAAMHTKNFDLETELRKAEAKRFEYVAALQTIQTHGHTNGCTCRTRLENALSDDAPVGKGEHKHQFVTLVEQLDWIDAYEPVKYEGGSYTGEVLRVVPQDVFCANCKITAEAITVLQSKP